MSLLILNSKSYPKSEDFTVEFAEPLQFRRIALQSFSMWVSWNNISNGLGNNTLSYFDGKNWSEVVFHDGNYSLFELNDCLASHFGLEEPPIKFDAMVARQRFVIKLKKGYKVDLSKSELHQILGFEPKIFENKVQEGKFEANISRGIDRIQIRCDIVEGARLNVHSSEVLYDFVPSNPPSSLISKEFFKPFYFKVKSSHVPRIRMRITNQDGELIDLNNHEVTYVFQIE